ncbi:ABC transporter permease [bacterium]|nr:ABC transporter permease [bacterium]
MIRVLGHGLLGLVREGRTLLLLTVVGVSLGVGSVVAIQTLNQGALQAFGGSVRAVSGQADLTVLGTVPTIDPALLPRVLADPAVRDAWPLCRLDAALADGSGDLIQIVGFDVFAPVRYPLTRQLDETGSAADPGDLVAAAMAVPGWCAVTPHLAASHGWAVGDTVPVSSGSRLARLVIGALVDFQRYEPLAPVNIAVMDVAQAQALLARPDAIHQIDIVLAGDEDPGTAAARLQRNLGPGVRVLTPEQRAEDAAGLLAAFRLNLTALSLISVFVGLFLVLASVQASLVRRRREFGVLRVLGMQPRQVLVLILAEAGVLGLLGVAIGIPTGFRIALWNVETVSATLTSIYVLEEISRLVLTPTVIIIGTAVGLGGALCGAVLPALDMSRRGVVELLSPLTMHEGARRTAVPLALLAVAAMTAGLLWFVAAGGGNRYAGFILGFVMLIGLPLLVPGVIRAAGAPLRPRGLGWVLSLRNLTIRLRTSSFAVAALAVTISMMVGITLLVGSFRQTLVTWLDVTIRADVYVSTESWIRAGNEAFLDAELLTALGGRPDVQAVETQRRLRVSTADGRHRVWLSGIAFSAVPGVTLASRLPLYAGDPEAVAGRLLASEAVVIGEPLARKAGLGPGDDLVLAGPDGPVSLPIAGVAFDYTSEAGTAFTTLETFGRHFRSDQPNNAALFLQPGADPDAVVAELQRTHRGRPLVFRSNATLRREVLAIFDQTFAVTRTLQTMALFIAACGLALAQLIQVRERAGELALFRALGATRAQISRMFLGEGLAMAGLGLALGLGGGAGLAALLILVINREWFGWTIRPDVPLGALALEVAVILGAALAAGIYPAWKSGLSSPAQLSRDDL